MRYVPLACLCVALGVFTIGCEPKKSFEGPTVDSFSGRVVKDGKPVSFPADRSVELKLIHHSAQTYGVPLSPEGTFKVGWMPIGKYSAMLVQEPPAGAKGGKQMYNVPGGFEIIEGKTEYEVELGKNWKQ
jgi:hypothetical protein